MMPSFNENGSHCLLGIAGLGSMENGVDSMSHKNARYGTLTKYNSLMYKWNKERILNHMELKSIKEYESSTFTHYGHG